jgi:hypothetical protein
MSSARPTQTAAGKVRTKNAKPKISPRPPKWDWTVMVYMAGDNSLTEEMVLALQDIKELLHGGGLKRRLESDILHLINV